MFRQRANPFLKKILMSEYFVLYISVIYFLALIPFIPKLASAYNVTNIFSNMWPLFVIAIGQTFVLIVAGIDLSQSSVVGLTSVVGALIMTTELNPTLFSKSPLWGSLLSETGGPLSNNLLAVPVAIVVMLIVGAVVGLINGFFITKFKMAPFMVTLISQMLFGSLAIYVTTSQNVTHLPAAYNAIGGANLGFVPISFFVAGIIGILFQLILTKTRSGKWFYAVGTNAKAAKISGVPTDKVIIWAYIFSGLCAAMASVLYSGRLEMGRPTLGEPLLMDIIGATVIGGTSMFGGKGKVSWTLFGVLFFTIMANTLNLLNLSFYTINIVKGSVIMAAALLDVQRIKLSKQTNLL
ncbi:MAG: ABC transporter permease [Vallitaleaceae bacterium]|nr:ABC transporter permease [Vallitaleaceae bacterium]